MLDRRVRLHYASERAGTIGASSLGASRECARIFVGGKDMRRSGSDRSFEARRFVRIGIRVTTTLALVAAPFAVMLSMPTVAAGAGGGGPVTLTKIATDFPNPIAIGFYAPTNQLVMSVNYRKGEPNNFDILDTSGHFTPFSNVSGLTDEVYLAAIRNSSCSDGFTAGDLYFGTGKAGAIARLSDDGATLTNPWVTLPGEKGRLRGGLHQDDACVAGGDLIVTTDVGDVWRVDAAGNARELASNFGAKELEGPITVPRDPARYGPWSGKILAADEKNNVVWSIDPNTGETKRSDVAGGAMFPGAEGVLLVPPGENFFGVDFGDSTVQGASASQFRDSVGDVVVPTEVGGKLLDVKWNGTSFVATDLLSIDVSRWEGTTFAPAALPGELVPGEGGCVATLTAPTKLSAAPGEQSATVSWAPATSNPPGCIEEYVVTPHGSGSPFHSLGQMTTTVVPGLTDGTTVTFTVAAANGGGLGPSSAPTTPITIGAPAAPSIAAATKIGHDTLKVDFRAPASNGAAITGFKVVCRSPNGGTPRGATGAASPLGVKHLTTGKTYICTVTATNRRGNSPPSVPSRPVKV